MTEERARYYAKTLARSVGVAFYAVRSREGRYQAVQVPSNDCEILATEAPTCTIETVPSRAEPSQKAA